MLQCVSMCQKKKEKQNKQTESKMPQLKWNISYMLKQRSFSITGQFWTHSDITQDLATLQERHRPITVARALGGNNITSSWSANQQNPLPPRPGRRSELVFTALTFKDEDGNGERSQEMSNAREKLTFFCGPVLKSRAFLKSTGAS